MIDLSISIVSWNTKSHLRDCLRSVRARVEGLTYEGFVVDNASTDGSPEMVGKEFPDVQLIANEQNRGFAAANNQALRLAQGRYVILLNPDTLVHRGALETMVRFMDGHPEAGAVGCRLLNGDGTLQRSTRRMPTFTTMLYDNTLLGKFAYFRRKVKDFKGKASEEVEEVDATSGAALMIRRSLLDEIGLMDEGYFMFLEEVDLCRRIWAKGFRVYVVPQAVITHLGGESRRQHPEIRLIVQRSLMRYFLKYEGTIKTTLFKLVYKPLFVVSLLWDLGVDALQMVKYQTLWRDPLRRDKRMARVQGALYFFRKNLMEFLFDL